MLQTVLSRRLNRWLLAFFSGVLMALSFPFTGSLFPLAFVAWVPLLLVEESYTAERKSYALFFQGYLAFLVYNVLTTWWIYFADPDGAYMAFICNSLVMAIAFYVFHRLKRKLGTIWNTPLLLCTWLTFEFLHFNWEISWPWLTLGNVFARVPELVQWYAWTGVLGGSLWILSVNIFVVKFLHRKLDLRQSWLEMRTFLIKGSFLIVLPVLVSLVVYVSYTETQQPYEIVAIQPNIDPYNEKFNGSDDEQLAEIMDLADKEVSPATQLVMAPETALYPNGNIVEEELHQKTAFHLLMERRARWNNASFLIGATTYKFFDQKNSRASRKDPFGPGYYEAYNSSILFKENRTPTIVHKSKLVLGVEKIPFSNIFPWLEDLSINLGGSSGSLGIEDGGPTVMKAGNVTFAPVVCYESVYGGFVRSQCKQGAGFIAIITNDGWWRDTPGYKQHFAFARLRAIENRKYVARSANTGTSGFINQRGDVLQQTGWWKETAIRQTIQLNERKTLYQLLGDYLGYFAVAGFLVFFSMRVLKSYRK